MYTSFAYSNRALQNVRFKWMINFPNLGLITDRNRSFGSYSNFSMSTCKLQTNFESYRCRTRLDPKRVLNCRSKSYNICFRTIFSWPAFQFILQVLLLPDFSSVEFSNSFANHRHVHQIFFWKDRKQSSQGPGDSQIRNARGSSIPH